MYNPFEKFSTHSRRALKYAFGAALSGGQRAVRPEHILYGISQQRGSVGAEILNRLKLTGNHFKTLTGSETKPSNRITQVGLTSTSRRLLEKAMLLASISHHRYIGTEHLLAAALEIEYPLLDIFFNEQHINRTVLKKQVQAILNSTSKFPDLTNWLDSVSNPGSGDELNLEPLSPFGQAGVRQPNALEFFATELTDEDLQKNIDPVIGRQDEISRLIQILSRRQKNNPILLGDPGVGKTAIVEGLAKQIIQGNVPEVLLGKKIFALDLSLVVAGTSFRGEFENRLKQIIAECKRNPDIILFIDEIHNITGAGSATGSMDAANILKPSLSRGEIRCIGATTTEDYKRHFESDAALERRFQPIYVNQPTIEKTIEILRGIKNNYELFHQVAIHDEALIAAAHLSERYLPDRFLPDKAIDLIDEAASKIKIEQTGDESLKKIMQLERKLRDISDKKHQRVEHEKYASALDFKLQEQKINEQVAALKTERLTTQQSTLGQITKAEIVGVVARITGIPSSDLLLEERKALLKLEQSLARYIVGQKEALSTLAEAIRRSRAGIGDTQRPIGSFIFLGPSGVGKTETAKMLAQYVFGSAESLIRIDMSEFAESFNISKLIGAPAGYVGYKEGAKLTDAVKRRPYAVVLFDEIEKAHPQVFNLLLSALEDGFITDATGKKINFRNTIIILTSNIGSEEFNQNAAIGFNATSDVDRSKADQQFDTVRAGVIKRLNQRFAPEFLNRIDHIIVFKPLTKNEVATIVKRQLQQLQERLARQNITLVIEPEVAHYVAKVSYAPETGARAVRKTIQNEIENNIAKHVLATNPKQLTVSVSHNSLVVS